MPKEKDGTMEHEISSPFVGGEDDDLMDMEYVANDQTESSVETMPPETNEEAELRKIDEPTNEELLAVDEAVKDAKELAEEAKAPAEEEPVAEEAEEEPAAEEAEEETTELKVPKDRFDEVNERMKRAEKQLEDLTAKVEEKPPEPEPDPYDYAAKEIEAMDALLEGNQDKYAALRSEIRTAEKEETLREARQIAESTTSQSREDITFEETGANIEASFPQFSTVSDTYDVAAREEMLDLYVGYARSGSYTRTEALQKAADQAARIYGFEATGAVVVPDNVTNIRKTDVKGKTEAANNQPPKMQAKAAGTNEEPQRDVLHMSDEEFDNLPESTKKRMRGDVL